MEGASSLPSIIAGDFASPVGDTPTQNRLRPSVGRFEIRGVHLRTCGVVAGMPPAGIEIACDESGFSGGSLASGHTTVFAHASVRITVPAARRLTDHLRTLTGARAGEVKFVRLRESHRRAVAEELLAATVPHVRLHLTDTTLFVLARLADLVVHGTEVTGTDSPAGDPRARALALGLRAAGPGQEFLVRAANLVRTHNRWVPKDPVAAFYDLPGLPDDIRRARPAIAEVRARHERNRKLTPLMEPVIPAFARTVEAWLATAAEVTVVHDEQSALTRHRLDDIAATVARRHPGGRLAGVRLVDSRADPRVQVADLLAGVARRVASDALAGRADEALTALLRPYVVPESTWVCEKDPVT
jgi:hypothetical protein